MPAQFWSLTWTEFQIKVAAFQRSEDRRRALVIELAARVGQYDEKARGKLYRLVNQLRRYPLKRWLLPE